MQIAQTAHDTSQNHFSSALVAESQPMRSLVQRLDPAALDDQPCVVVGEPGAGKELVARVLHARGPRRRGPLVVYDGTHDAGPLLPDRGAPGQSAFERARGGTLILDDPAGLPAAAQSTLAIALREAAARRARGSVGGGESPAGARVIVTTHRPPDEEARAGRMPADLATQLGPSTLRVPSLRHRLDDVPLLCAQFMSRMRRDGELSGERVSSPAMERLLRHGWPGNVRELRNAIHRAMLACDGTELRPEHLPPGLGDAAHAASDDEPVMPLAELEKREIIKALGRTRGNVTQAAVQLGIGRATLYRRIAELDLRIPGSGIGRKRANGGLPGAE